MNLVLERLSRKPFAVVGHRGAAGLAPENTITALRKAIEAGADIAEFDVQRTGDGVLVASHDPVVKHGGGILDIRSASYEEVRRVELPGGEYVPRIEELLAEARGRIALFLEVKEPSDTHTLIDLILSETAEDYVAIISFHEEVVKTVKSRASRIPAGIIYFKPPGKIVECRRLRCELVLPRYPLATAKAVSFAHRLGLRVVAWTVNEPNLVVELARRGVDGIATDYPDMAVVIRSKLAQGSAKGG
ncbi:glycerophosphodiester phosphodiesterase [Hyperthermus butylicus]|uniref:Glycerophosphoryl diester phosphodiesterase n=1 Tax=Hyperthermus butylicus (strain DSM 5456 / JCM 9403 / PLM1-5) TaxID=415426 RepID=A2BKZ7_HYPBU|nr:glycerophosphodiester phosphodiesterase [Hyperthermus butylicus]ABM80658.1 glycerophosphoryl diester phosphodiesterase [Hyperthermus butylicus DSM 5456]